MLWASDFVVPGDLDSRVTRKQGIDTWFKTPHGGVFTLDVGQKTTIFSDDFDLRGRWDVALGDAAGVRQGLQRPRAHLDTDRGSIPGVGDLRP